MKHEYKVGDKVRMLEDYSELVEGETYRVEIVGRGDGNLPIQVGEHGDWPMVGTYEPVTEEDNKDLTENRIPFGLLEPDVQKRMKAWEHGCEYWDCGNVWLPHTSGWGYLDHNTYRAKPAPVEPERVTQWVNAYPSGITTWPSLERAQNWSNKSRIALWRITYDKDTGLNPVIEGIQSEVET